MVSNVRKRQWKELGTEMGLLGDWVYCICLNCMHI